MSVSPQSETERAALDRLLRGLDRRVATYLNACVRCDLCAESCHVYLADRQNESTPARKVDRLARLYRRYRTLLGSVAPRLVGAADLNDTTLAELAEAAFGRCTGCGRCAFTCSVGLDPAAVLRFGRSVAAAAGLVPQGIRTNADNTASTGNNMRIDDADVLDTVGWLEEDLRDTLGDPTVSIPIDRAGARVWYLVNPSEIKFFPLSLSAAAMIFHAIGEDWTLSSRDFDVTNYGFFASDPRLARDIAARTVERASQLGIQEVVMAECGHGYRSLRWEAPEWLGRPLPFEVQSFVEVMARHIQAGSLVLDPRKNPDRITLHDPCNLVRNGGVIEEQRVVLRAAAADFVEMTPNRVENYCCGGGGGAVAASELKQKRLETGRIKAEQIRSTGARVVASPCHNCITQLKELSSHYALGIEVRTLAEIVADALVLPPRGA